MEEQKKMTIEEFRSIKDRIKELVSIFEEKFKDFDERQFPDIDSAIEFLGNIEEIKEIIRLTNYLLSCDLSLIPFNEWEGIVLFTNADPRKNYLDFSKTHANIDFINNLSYFELISGDFRGCKIQNVDKLPLSALGTSKFDAPIISDYPELFISNLFDEEFKKKYYAEEIVISDIVNLNEEQLTELTKLKRLRINNYLSYGYFKRGMLPQTLIEMYKEFGEELFLKFLKSQISLSDMRNANNHPFFEKYMQTIAIFKDSKEHELFYELASKYGYESFWDFFDRNYDFISDMSKTSISWIGLQLANRENIDDAFEEGLRQHIYRWYTHGLVPECIISRGYRVEEFRDYNQLLDEKIILKPKETYSSKVINYNMIDKDKLRAVIEANKMINAMTTEELNYLIRNIDDDLDIVREYWSHISYFVTALPPEVIKMFPHLENELIDAIHEGSGYPEIIESAIGDKHPEFFLRKDKPDFLSEEEWNTFRRKFYDKELTYEIFINTPQLLDYLKDTQIVYGMPNSFLKLRNVSNEALIYLLQKTSGKVLDNDVLEYVLNHTGNRVVDIQEFKHYVVSYFKEKDIVFSLLGIFEETDEDYEYVGEIANNFNTLLRVRPELDVGNPALSGKLISREIVSKYGFDVVSSILEYNTGANKILIQLTEDGDELIVKWINYIKKLPNYSKKNVHFAILGYNTCKDLISEIVSTNATLDDKQITLLFEILSQKNRFNVRSLSELNNYSEHRKKELADKINSDDIGDVQDAILLALFNVNKTEVNKIFKDFGLSSEEYARTLFEDQIINGTEFATIEIIRQIINETDIKKLKENYDDFAKREIITDFQQISYKLKKHYGKEFKDSLFKAPKEDTDKIRHYDVPGLTGGSFTNIDGEQITSDSRIEVVELNGVDFKLLIHKLHDYDANFANYASRIIKDPSLWNKLEGASTLSTSMISEIHLACVGWGGSDCVYYGFNDISDDSLMLMGRRDIFVEHGGRKLEPTSHINEYMSPDLLQSLSEGYNEVALDRKSSNSDRFDRRIQPSCIICFDSINDESKRAAQYFKIPIYLIRRMAYEHNSINTLDSYKNGINKITNKFDVKKIMCLHGKIEGKVDIVIQVLEDEKNAGTITLEEYIELLNECKKYISMYSAHSNIGDALTKIKNKIEEAKKERLDTKFYDKKPEINVTRKDVSSVTPIISITSPDETFDEDMSGMKL